MASLTITAASLLAVPLLLIPPPAGEQRATKGDSSPVVIQKVAQVRHVPEADVTFSGRPTEDGGFAVEARGGELRFEKTSLPGGGFTLDLEAPNDVVAIELTVEGVKIARNGRAATVSLTAGTDADLEAASRLLNGSRAVRLTRRAAEALQLVEDSSAAGTSLLMADALVGLLTGDEGAPARLARRLARAGRGRVRRAQTVDCYGIWEGNVLRASYEYDYCYFGFPAWNTMRNVCAYRWLLQIESYWFSLISCVGFSQF